MSPAGTVATPSSMFRGTIRPAPMVTQVVRGDATVLADFRHARYYTLNPVSGRIWSLVREGITLSTLLARLHDEYDAPTERIDADAVALLEMLRAAHLITCQPVAAPPASRPRGTYNLRSMGRDGAALGTEAESARERMGVDTIATAIAGEAEQPVFQTPSVIRCGLLIAAVKIALQMVGWGTTWRWIRRRAERAALGNEDAAVAIARTEYAVAMAGALYPGRALCLEQSLVLYYLLRRRGIPATFHLGVQPHPFAAHAWVEHRGEPINDVAEHVKYFTPLPAEAL